MLYLKLINSFSSSREDLCRFFTIYGHVRHLGNVTWFMYKHIGFPLSIDGQAVLEKIVGNMHVYTYGWGGPIPGDMFPFK